MKLKPKGGIAGREAEPRKQSASKATKYQQVFHNHTILGVTWGAKRVFQLLSWFCKLKGLRRNSKLSKTEMEAFLGSGAKRRYKVQEQGEV